MVAQIDAASNFIYTPLVAEAILERLNERHP